VQYLLVFVAVLLVGAAVFLAVGRRRGEVGPDMPRGALVLGLAEPVASLPAVLLPEQPTAQDIARLRLGVGLRGYRCDQVDEVLEALAEEIDRLNDELSATRRGPVISTTNHSPE